jgi:hypothetical protein
MKLVVRALRPGNSGLGVRAQFRSLFFVAGNRAVLNCDLTPKPDLPPKKKWLVFAPLALLKTKLL